MHENLVVEDMRYLAVEHLRVISLDPAGVLLGNEVVFMGTNESCDGDMPTILRNILKHPDAQKFMCVHNHPGAEANSIPSETDIKSSAELHEVSEKMGLEYLGMMIISGNDFSHFAPAEKLVTVFKEVTEEETKTEMVKIRHSGGRLYTFGRMLSGVDILHCSLSMRSSDGCTFRLSASANCTQKKSTIPQGQHGEDSLGMVKGPERHGVDS